MNEYYEIKHIEIIQKFNKVIMIEINHFDCIKSNYDNEWWKNKCTEARNKPEMMIFQNKVCLY